jgi:hypothetical protein
LVFQSKILTKIPVPFSGFGLAHIGLWKILIGRVAGVFAEALWIIRVFFVRPTDRIDFSKGLCLIFSIIYVSVTVPTTISALPMES